MNEPRKYALEFQKEIEQIVNKYSMENESNTPDFILANYIIMSLDAFNKTVELREAWYGRAPVAATEPLLGSEK